MKKCVELKFGVQEMRRATTPRAGILPLYTGTVLVLKARQPLACLHGLKFIGRFRLRSENSGDELIQPLHVVLTDDEAVVVSTGYLQEFFWGTQ